MLTGQQHWSFVHDCTEGHGLCFPHEMPGVAGVRADHRQRFLEMMVGSVLVMERWCPQQSKPGTLCKLAPAVGPRPEHRPRSRSLVEQRETHGVHQGPVIGLAIAFILAMVMPTA